MDASAYLQKQGWRGSGHSLDRTDRGIKKPLLVSKKVDVLGVGLNKHQAVSDQWWLRAFDQGLKTFGTGQESALGNVQKHGVNRGGLYARFVQGEGVPGSIGQSPVTGSEAGTGAITPTEPHHNGQTMMSLVSQPEGIDAGNSESKKRKRDEDPEEKRARRKKERKDRSKDHARKNEQKAEDEGRLSRAEKRQNRMKEQINKQADECVREAQRRGLISIDPKEDGNASTEPGPSDEPSETFKAIMAQAGLVSNATSFNSAEQPGKAQKHSREKMKREVKRAAKIYLASNGPLAKSISEGSKSKKAERNITKANERIDKIDDDGHLTGEKSLRKHTGEKTSPVRVNSADLDVNADEVKFGFSSRGGQKSIPGVGAVDRYPTKSEKKARKAAARSAANTEVDTKHLSPEKLAEYTTRAGRKGMSVEDYIRRRADKRASKQAKTSAAETDDEELDFVIDTTGDSSLAVKAPGGIPVGAGNDMYVADTEGDATLHSGSGNEPVPLDPRIWKGIKPKDMPKPMRKARKEWMKARREEKRGQNDQAEPLQTPKKSKSERKVEARDNFVKQLLFRSREALRNGSNEDASTTIEGVENVPLVRVKSNEGSFSKEEIALARTVTRRVLRDVKREEKAKLGKGKGHKKRSAKEAARETGISGPTNRASLASGAQSNGRTALLA